MLGTGRSPDVVGASAPLTNYNTALPGFLTLVQKTDDHSSLWTCPVKGEHGLQGSTTPL
jgi:hypothetical protein